MAATRGGEVLGQLSSLHELYRLAWLGSRLGLGFGFGFEFGFGFGFGLGFGFG